MKKEITISEIFKTDAIEIEKKRQKSLLIHSKNIRAAGDEVELFVRDYFIKRIPKRYYVSQGHLIDDICNISPQLDLIISDSSNLPSLLTTENDTEFIPIDSTYIIGEIKSSYIKSKKYIQYFSKTLKTIHDNLNHKEIINTAFNGISEETNMRDIYLEDKYRILNSIFSFMIFVDSGNFNFSDISSFLASTENEYLPNVIVFLDRGLIEKIKISSNNFTFTVETKSPTFIDYEWCFVPIIGEDRESIMGNNLALLYFYLIRHLSRSFLEPPSFEKFIANKIKFDRTKIEIAKTDL